MAPSLLSPNIPHVLLQYISPPSQLTQPIPSHLLSQTLLQRHHYLRLTPDTPDEYLCWPSSPEKRAQILDLLESRPKPLDDDQPLTFPIQYSFDGEEFFAHVNVSDDGDGVRLILQWHDAGDWRYHNLDLMPFPSGSRSSLEDILVPPASPVRPVTAHAPALRESSLASDEDEDDYWNSYGSTDIGDSAYSDGIPTCRKDTSSSEDAYWAQYSSVHGTADSTIPSPVAPNRRKPLPAVHAEGVDEQESSHPPKAPYAESYDEPLSIPPSMLSRPPIGSRWDPASPSALAHLLSTISPRSSPLPSPALDGLFEPEEELSSPTIGDSESSSSSALGLSQPALVATGMPIPSAGAFVASVPYLHRTGTVEEEASAEEDEDEADLKIALAGVWRLWKKKTGRNDFLMTRHVSTRLWLPFAHVHADAGCFLHPALFRRTFETNTQLHARVEELEQELSVWKEAFKTADGDRKVLNKTVLRLERNIGALKEDNPLVVCLIDGDGNIFSSDLIKQGQVGGRQAAMLLTKGLSDHLASIDPSEASAPGRGQIWLTIYCNKSGLVETLISNAVCTMEEFEAFMLGFNQASPLFSIVDVGSGKEAADSKIKECLRVFTRFPQTVRVFFGGAHDNGYTSTLNLLQNEGLLDKIVLLKGYKDLAHEIHNLNLPQLEIAGVFIQKKLYTNGNKKANVSTAAFTTPPMAGTPASTSYNKSPKPKHPTVQQQDSDKARQSKPSPPSTNFQAFTPSKKVTPLDPSQPLHKQRPPPCNFFYLARCNNGEHCKYEHNYPLTPDQVGELRVNAKKWPCPAVNNGNRCPLGDHCIMNHFCPKGLKCVFRKQGKCKFVGKKIVITKPRKPRKPDPSKKRGLPTHDASNRDLGADDDDEAVEEPPKKVAKADHGEGVRRSARNRGKELNYKDDGEVAAMLRARALPRVVSAARDPNLSKRNYDPKTYGAIPGVPVGSWWETRQACSADSIHAPWVAGISAGPHGAYSIALSGGYEDDVDFGEGFTFTGSGGRDLKGTRKNPKNLRTGPQTYDQTFDNPFNAALKRSSETKKPVRVIRGYKLHSEFAPAEGYRYDGLYTVERAWQEPGMNPKGHLVCKYALKRIPGQPPLLTAEEHCSEVDEDEPTDEVNDKVKAWLKSEDNVNSEDNGDNYEA
ncbi:uncharacterized protein BXZ73DRAFT_40022 [Epithele typhae]|uniref:uncharacterized protein n=1 Tax=Epithele typhae TaxID=378194 RepID=UPI002008A7E8|nr:uncharacterized protein BXZ73DRAFT_40022 [Epithele typhae]KAH9944404.1 hypothetical protein BXZ73DRAFT_40022 [Epithele typhae]